MVRLLPPSFNFFITNPYFKSYVFYKTDNFGNTDTTKYVLESQVLDVIPCQKSKRYHLYFLCSELLNSGFDKIFAPVNMWFWFNIPPFDMFFIRNHPNLISMSGKTFFGKVNRFQGSLKKIKIATIKNLRGGGRFCAPPAAYRVKAIFSNK